MQVYKQEYSDSHVRELKKKYKISEESLMKRNNAMAEIDRENSRIERIMENEIKEARDRQGIDFEEEKRRIMSKP